MPCLYGGFYVTGEGQLGGYHPLHWALYRWLPLGAAFDLRVAAQLSNDALRDGVVSASVCCGARDAAWFGGLAFTFGGFNLLHFVHPNAIAVVAHLPWLLLAIDVALVDNSLRRRAAAELSIGLLTASQLLLGYPQYVWFSLLTETAYVIWRCPLLTAACGEYPDCYLPSAAESLWERFNCCRRWTCSSVRHALDGGRGVLSHRIVAPIEFLPTRGALPVQNAQSWGRTRMSWGCIFSGRHSCFACGYCSSQPFGGDSDRSCAG